MWAGGEAANVAARCERQTTAYSRHSPGTPAIYGAPRSSNESPTPATRSFTVGDTSTSSAVAVFRDAGAASRDLDPVERPVADDLVSM